MPGVQQAFYRLHQFIEVKPCREYLAVFQIQMIRIRQHHQNAGGVRIECRKAKRCGEREMTNNFHNMLLLLFGWFASLACEMRTL
ncbi:hypothetical protein BN131_861 [Cronobacter malonaticus 681]|nr:hypothetical protein BN131_861 [Cronobacter malonaticus 681]